MGRWSGKTLRDPSRVRRRTHARATVKCDQAKGADRLAQNGKGYEAGSRIPDRYSPSRNPVDSATLRLRKTDIRNEVTSRTLSARSRAEQGRLTGCVRAGGMVQEAKARGNARDMLTWTTTVGR